MVVAAIFWSPVKILPRPIGASYVFLIRTTKGREFAAPRGTIRQSTGSALAPGSDGLFPAPRPKLCRGGGFDTGGVRQTAGRERNDGSARCLCFSRRTEFAGRSQIGRASCRERVCQYV